MFWWQLGLLFASRNHLTTFCRPSTHYACLRLCSAIVHSSETIVFILSAKADQRKCWPQWLHYHFCSMIELLH